MKTRNVEAKRLEADYIARLRAALAGREESEIPEIVGSVREHIEEALAEAPEGEVSLVQIANILERLGPPESYVQEEPPEPQVAPMQAASEPPSLSREQ